ncbi:MAG: tRNA (guanosine(37)-N1)-methyltransferase TrmD [Candidatus Margulisbacteria bacterium]|nr:tRNA (guanosine(37)-N1)-methyltransferase TrmD [Candidatus Margulisiibacteriota bacterium]MBU1617411.1 tRNA (guanosine(37)-N1)-methyltransferase TrmD [Candidatus Margulisiibacteriota bacterium]
MRVDVLTLFPEMFQGPMSESLIQKAREKGLLNLRVINIRDFALDKHKTADDTPYGGGPGMVMKADIVAQAIRSLKMEANKKVILLCPTGEKLTQAKVNQLARFEQLVFVCGHYEGIDERVAPMIDEKVSIGDFVVTGGELPAMIVIDAVARQIPGVVKEVSSVEGDSFFAGWLDFPSFTKPETFEGAKVPEVLLSGHHAQIKRWRKKAALQKTLFQRPDLLAEIEFNEGDRALMTELFREEGQ